MSSPVPSNKKCPQMTSESQKNLAEKCFREFPSTIIDRIFSRFTDEELIKFFDKRKEKRNKCSNFFWRRRLNRLLKKCYVYEHLIDSETEATFVAGFKFFFYRKILKFSEKALLFFRFN